MRSEVTEADREAIRNLGVAIHRLAAALAHLPGVFAHQLRLKLWCSTREPAFLYRRPKPRPLLYIDRFQTNVRVQVNLPGNRWVDIYMGRSHK